jgi:hypothetical protein
VCVLEEGGRGSEREVEREDEAYVCVCRRQLFTSASLWEAEREREDEAYVCVCRRQLITCACVWEAERERR